ncbi:hypothetical protein JANAI62_03340 [Jannaschia pagri]|uniref:Type IV secretion system coupling protein TraD DNA-binding domain-containing protein n=1 Tax=Jannaschia pagri TaxID=2829797 RepID=A0ABQ4NH06_9RHOB|nr:MULTISPECIES: type IV secretion system DNA-binding domain-containing protein [unclassified Jannaschia]GIT90183.1 hypothetical protein JANAI61_06410 [Jannaschia sp. AI_61]GIT93711.1 hypothetical protein JANAI62_03340 [Jannaschia sp. AI_62]
MDDALGLVFAAFIFVCIVFAVVAASSAIAIAAVPGAIGYAIYWTQVKSPAARERQAKDRTMQLYRSVKGKFTAIDIPDFIGGRIGYPDDDDPNSHVQFEIATRLVTFENLDDYPPEPPELCDTIEGGRYRDFLNQVSPDDYRARLEHICNLAELCNRPITNETVATVIYTAVEVLDDGRPILPVTRKKLDEHYSQQKGVAPQDYKGDHIVRDYLRGTPLELMGEMVFEEPPVAIPDHLRNQHHMIIGGTGHGKTQCLQEMILRDLEDENACVVVIDSQEGMLERLLHVVSWDRAMYLDAGNIRKPLALSAFAIGSTTRPEDEPRVRMATALYEHMFASRETKFTTKQQTLYRFLSRFLFVIPDANFDTALDILENGFEPYGDYVAHLEETEQSFVRGNLDNPKAKGASQGYRQTRQEVAQRLYTLLESATIRRMFNSPENRVDIPQAIRDDKIILINTAQQTLGLEGASLFGRYCIAQIAMEVLARPETPKRVYFYIDEAQEYLSGDPIIHRLFEQGRKRGLCMICAFHRLGQIGEDLTDMMRSLTSIKFAGGISNADATKLAKEMRTDAETITGQPALSFWAWFKGQEPGVYRVTPQVLEDRISAEPDDIDTLKEMMVMGHHYDPEASEEPDERGDEVETAEDGEAPPPSEEDFASYYNDGWDDDAPSEPKPKPSRRDPPTDDVDPDAPQNLD